MSKKAGGEQVVVVGEMGSPRARTCVPRPQSWLVPWPWIIATGSVDTRHQHRGSVKPCVCVFGQAVLPLITIPRRSVSISFYRFPLSWQL